jgi:hypothetical protein
MLSKVPGDRAFVSNPTYHRIGLVIAEVNQSTNARFDANMRKARRAGEELHRLAMVGKELMESAGAIEGLSGPRAAREYATCRVSAKLARELEKLLPPWLKEHRAQLQEASDEAALSEFLGWTQARAQGLLSRARAFEVQVAAEIREDAEKLRELAADWSAVDADGWNND